MYLLILSISCAVLEFSAIKIFKKMNINVVYAIVYSYPIALISSIIVFKPDLSIDNHTLSMLPLLAVLGLLMVNIFICMVISVEKSGIIVSVVAQRLSLVIPVLYSLLIFKENLNYSSLIGILIAFASMLLVIPYKNSNNSLKRSSWVYPICIFIGIGVIDILYGYIVKANSINFDKALTLTFLIATIGAPFIVKIFKETVSLDYKTIIAGIILGVINFSAIYFFTSALKHFNGTTAIVFVMQAVGVITLGLLSGTVIFKEKITAKKIVGISLAVISIVILSIYTKH